MIVRDLARVNDLEFSEANKIAKMIPDELNITLDESVKKSPNWQPSSTTTRSPRSSSNKAG